MTRLQIFHDAVVPEHRATTGVRFAGTNMPLSVDEIVIDPGRRPAKPEKVKVLVDSIREIGLVTPIAVRRDGDS
jgi:hypothetical protein